jgi:hypothetical protein
MGVLVSSKTHDFISRYYNETICSELTNGCKMTWNYFAIGHGKGEVDGVGVSLKHDVKNEQLKPNGMKIQNAHEATIFLKVESNKFHASYLVARKVVNKYVWEVKEVDIDKA